MPPLLYLLRQNRSCCKSTGLAAAHPPHYCTGQFFQFSRQVIEISGLRYQSLSKSASAASPAPAQAPVRGGQLQWLRTSLPPISAGGSPQACICAPQQVPESSWGHPQADVAVMRALLKFSRSSHAMHYKSCCLRLLSVLPIWHLAEEMEAEMPGLLPM